MAGLNGVQRIADERDRQRAVEGYDASHDDAHDVDELARAACCYATPPRHRRPYGVPHEWPWDDRFWKPGPQGIQGRVRELVKAGALIAAEIDRLLRFEADEAAAGRRV